MEYITSSQLEEIQYEITPYPDIEEWLLENLDLRTLDKIPRDKFGIVIKRIREIKNVREGK